jgi:predicted nucleic acid-binding protein
VGKGSVPRVYVDSCVYLNVIKRESGLWPDSLKVLLAAERGDIRLIASTLVLAEVASYKGDVDPDKRDEVISRYLENLVEEWSEVDLFTVHDARRLCDPYKLRGADAVHLATAMRRKAAYFISRDARYPYGTTIGTETQITVPKVLWQPTLDDHQVDLEAATEAGS